MRCLITGVIAVFFIFVDSSAQSASVGTIYKDYCAQCHGGERLGIVGPALLPDNLKQLSKDRALATIINGRPSGQMPAFGEVLAKDQVESLVDFIYQPLAKVPDWTVAEISASHIVHIDPAQLPGSPQHNADPLNLFSVVESGDHHVTILDGDSFTPLWRFKSRFALHGGVKYSPDGRFIYLASRDGWVSKYDLHSFQMVSEIRVGINTRNIAVSTDGKWVIAGNFLPHDIVILNAHDLSLFKIIEAKDANGNSSRVSGVYNAPPRISFIAAMKDLKEVWELSYDPDAAPVYGNFVHSYRENQVEAVIVEAQPFARRRIALENYLDNFFFDPSYAEVIGASDQDQSGVVYNLDARRKVSNLKLGGMANFSSAITWKYKGRTVIAMPNMKNATISIIDMKTWEVTKNIETLGPGLFLHSHNNTDYVWADVLFGPNKGALQIFDKRTLEIVMTIHLGAGKKPEHVEFTHDGKYALASVSEMDGAIIVYDASTFTEVKRIPMKRPTRTYNVHNTIAKDLHRND